MYGRAADAQRQPSPPSSRRGHGRPPEGPPDRSWGIRHTISSLLGWSNETQALPPLALSGQHASLGDGHSDGEVHHQPAIFQDSPLFDVHFTLQWRDLSWAVYLCAQY